MRWLGPRCFAMRSRIPSTMAAGILLSFFVACLKYADPRWLEPEQSDSWRWLGSLPSDPS